MSKICVLCKSNTDNEIEFGKFMNYNKINVHYYCLLLTTQLIQRGDDNEGILGFLEKDILHEANRIRSQKCYICKKSSANIACCKQQCLYFFHTNCAIGMCLFEFSGTFRSFCHRHHNVEYKNPHKSDEICSICYEEMGKYNPITSLKAICCNNGWFHKSCVTKFANTAGYFFKCPLCNNSDDFRLFVSKHGVFVPDQDAAWELEPNAFAELLERPKNCQAEECLCPESREFKSLKWPLCLCKTCGSFLAHRSCWRSIQKKYNIPLSEFICSACVTNSNEEEDEVDDNLSVASSLQSTSSNYESGNNLKDITKLPKRINKRLISSSDDSFVYNSDDNSKSSDRSILNKKESPKLSFINIDSSSEDDFQLNGFLAKKQKNELNESDSTLIGDTKLLRNRENIKKCQAEECLCPQSREFKSKQWALCMCKTCKSFFAHRSCWLAIQKSNNILYFKFICSACITNSNAKEDEVDDNLSVASSLQSSNNNYKSGNNLKQVNFRKRRTICYVSSSTSEDNFVHNSDDNSRSILNKKENQILSVDSSSDDEFVPKKTIQSFHVLDISDDSQSSSSHYSLRSYDSKKHNYELNQSESNIILDRKYYLRNRETIKRKYNNTSNSFSLKEDENSFNCMDSTEKSSETSEKYEIKRTKINSKRKSTCQSNQRSISYYFSSKTNENLQINVNNGTKKKKDKSNGTTSRVALKQIQISDYFKKN